MARCAYCKEETEIYIGGDVPICTECLDAQEAERDHLHGVPVSENVPGSSDCADSRVV